MITTKTPNGFVLREITPTGEHSYRVTNGEWSHCYGHKGPWLAVPRADVPPRFIEAFRKWQTEIA